jgi:predicted ATPase/DNA-binding SARP family transcriptional activator
VLFGILGAVEARSGDGGQVNVGGPRLRSLLALLALDAGRVVTVERLIDGLYGEETPPRAANALQAQISRLRARLRDAGAPDGMVEFAPAGYRLAADPEDVDAHRFDRLAREGRAALAAGDHAGAAGLLRQALGLWRGPALTDVADVPFAGPQAARLEEARVAAFEDRAEAELALGEHGALAGELGALVAEYPLRERLRGQLMRALYGAGRQAEALAVFEDARGALAAELGADPSPELAAVHLAVLRADPSLTAAAPAGRRARAAIPARLTSFVGRGEELQRIAALLADARLVTLTGPGGAGKTRLAVEVARPRPEEVCFVDLAALGDGAQVPQAVLVALGLREGGLLPAADGLPDPLDRLVTALTDRATLLILDNCEHVVDDAARLAHRLLGACPGLRVLATSREALGITGESLCPLPPLALPPPGTAPAGALGFPAVRLFADRAAAVRPGFEVDEANAGLVVRICATLDGLPLAIELAAARLRSLPLKEVAARLDDRFRLLSRGDRTAAPRHQTLRAVVEWSWDLLEEAERELARRLTVFAGGATLDAVERVCAPSDVVETLGGLADKSLIESRDGRYRMLDTIRVFCAERLAADEGEERRLRRTHAEYFLGLARTGDPYLRRAEQLEWMARLSAEHANFQAALRWAVHADARLALRLLGALSGYWFLRGLRTEAAPPAADLLAMLGPEPPEGLEEEYVLCVLHATPGSTAPAGLRPHWRTAESIMDTLAWPSRQPFVNVLWALTTGPIEPASMDLAIGRMGATGDPWFEALGHFSLSYLRLYAGETAEAEASFGEVLERFRAIGDRWGTAQVLDALAMLADLRGDPARALALTDEGLELVAQLDAREELAEFRCRRGDRLMRAGDLDAARADSERAVGLARRAGVPATLALAHRGLGEVARLRGDLAEARRRQETALGVSATGWQSEGARGQVLTALGRIAEAEGDLGQAATWHGRALDVAVRHRNLPTLADAAEGAAGLALLEGDGERAALLLGAGVAVRGTSLPGDPDIGRVVAGATDMIGAAAYAAAFDRGASMTRQEVLDLLAAARLGTTPP